MKQKIKMTHGIVVKNWKYVLLAVSKTGVQAVGRPFSRCTLAAAFPIFLARKRLTASVSSLLRPPQAISRRPDFMQQVRVPIKHLEQLDQGKRRLCPASLIAGKVPPDKWVQMRARLIQEIDEEKDSLRFYFLGANWRQRVEHVGAKVALDQEGPLII